MYERCVLTCLVLAEADRTCDLVPELMLSPSSPGCNQAAQWASDFLHEALRGFTALCQGQTLVVCVCVCGAGPCPVVYIGTKSIVKEEV